MSIIKVDRLSKVFERPVRSEGFRGMAKDLFKRRYEEKTAVDQLSFQIDEGEVVGYLGPNGAGKSTSIKMLVGILVPTSGCAEVLGVAPYKHRVVNSQNIGVVFGQRSQLWWDIPVSETLNLMKYMYKLPDKQFRKNLNMFSDILGLQEFSSIAVRQLSLGQRMRAELCAALLHNPKIVYLDEPTIGLDVVVKKKIREFLLEIRNEYKTTILLTTHDMSDVEKLCSRVLVINHGQKIYDGGLEKLKGDYGTGEYMVVRTEGPMIGSEALSELKIKKAVRLEDTQTAIYFDRNEISSAQILSWLMARTSILDFEVKNSELEDVIRNIYDINKAD